MAEMIISIPAIEDNEIEEEKVFEEEIENRCIFLDDEITEETLSKITKQILRINKKDKKIEYKDRQPIYLIIDKSDAESYSLEKVCCPDYGNEINTKFDELKCPNCESLL